MTSNKRHLDEYSFEEICRRVEPLSIYENTYDQFLFIRAVIDVLRFELRKERGLDILCLTTADEITEFTKLKLKERPKLENSMALIVITTAIRSEILAKLAQRGKTGQR
jgi:hypothetical protein